MENSVLEDKEVAGEFGCLCLNRSARPSVMRLDHFRPWLQSATWVDSPDLSQLDMDVGLIQAAFCEVHIAKD